MQIRNWKLPSSLLIVSHPPCFQHLLLFSDVPITNCFCAAFPTAKPFHLTETHKIIFLIGQNYQVNHSNYSSVWLEWLTLYPNMDQSSESALATCLSLLSISSFLLKRQMLPLSCVLGLFLKTEKFAFRPCTNKFLKLNIHFSCFFFKCMNVHVANWKPYHPLGGIFSKTF